MAPLISSSVKGRDGAGHTASPLGQPAPLAQTNPQANPHQTRGSTRVSRSAHILPRTRPHRVFSTVRISSPCRRRDGESLLHPVGTTSCLAGAASYGPTPPPVATPSVSIRPHSSPTPAVPYSSPAPGMRTSSTPSLVGRSHCCRHR
jgi:hypothetical protein